MTDVAQQIRERLNEYDAANGSTGTDWGRGEMQGALLAVLGLWQDPVVVAERPHPTGPIAEAMATWEAGRAKGIDEAVDAIGHALGVVLVDPRDTALDEVSRLGQEIGGD